MKLWKKSLNMKQVLWSIQVSYGCGPDNTAENKPQTNKLRTSLTEMDYSDVRQGDNNIFIFGLILYAIITHTITLFGRKSTSTCSPTNLHDTITE